MGVDYDEKSVNKIKEYDRNMPVYVSNVEATPFDDGYFNAHMSLGVLEHFCYGSQKAIREANRILKPGGIFIVMLPYLNMLLRLKLPVEKLKKNNMIRRLFGKEEKDFYCERYFKTGEISSLLEEGGFDIEKVIPIDHIFTFFSFSRNFRDKNTYDGENDLAVKFADFSPGYFRGRPPGQA